MVKFHLRKKLICCIFYLHIIILEFLLALISCFLSSFFFVFFFDSLCHRWLRFWLWSFILWLLNFVFNFHRFFGFTTNSFSLIIRFVQLFISWPLFHLDWRSLHFFCFITMFWIFELIFMVFIISKWKINFLLLIFSVVW